jgi:flagellar protein FliO/FliZ
MIIRLILSLAFIGGVLFFAAKVAKKRGLGQGNGLIEVVARQRMGRTSSVNVLRIGDVVLVVGATEEHVTLLAEVDSETVETALQQQRTPLHLHAAGEPGAIGTAAPAARVSTGALAGSVFDRNGWGSFVHQLRERTVRRS